MPEVQFARPDGVKTRGYLALAGNGKPGIVVIQEWWGLNDQICGIADRFARAGYNALAPDLYKGRVTAVADEANHLMSGLDFPGAFYTPIMATAPGVVSFTGVRSGYGNTVEIDHGGGFKTRYAHLATIGVHVGQRVSIGFAGSAAICRSAHW